MTVDCQSKGVLYDLATGKVRKIKYSGKPLVIKEHS